MRKYLLVLIPVVACAVFVAAIAANSARPRAIGVSSVGDPGRLSVEITPVPVVTRREAIGWAIAASRAMGEDKPALAYISLGSYLDEVRKLYPKGTAVDGASVVPPDTLVWTVRMRGSFAPPSQPAWADIKLTPGVMDIEINTLTGDVIGSGYIPDNPKA